MDIIITKELNIKDYKNLIKLAGWKELNDKQLKKLFLTLCV